MKDDYLVKGIQKHMKTLIVFGLCFFSLPFIYDLVDTQEDIDSDKTVELLNSSITGYDKGKIAWKIVTNHAWATNSRYI